MTDRPILFTAPMVRAILAGTKTQTRRIVKDNAWVTDDCDAGYDGQTIGVPPYIDRFRCPYGQPGDRLWVRETWHAHRAFDAVPPSKLPKIDGLHYASDPLPRMWDCGKQRPSIHMPRWASRILLEVTAVRAERLQQISAADAIAEGIRQSPNGRWEAPLVQAKAGTICAEVHDPRVAYQALWESINSPNSWVANIWVWAISFRVISARRRPA